MYRGKKGKGKGIEKPRVKKKGQNKIFQETLMMKNGQRPSRDPVGTTGDYREDRERGGSTSSFHENR